MGSRTRHSRVFLFDESISFSLVYSGKSHLQDFKVFRPGHQLSPTFQQCDSDSVAGGKQARWLQSQNARTCIAYSNRASYLFLFEATGYAAQKSRKSRVDRWDDVRAGIEDDIDPSYYGSWSSSGSAYTTGSKCRRTTGRTSSSRMVSQTSSTTNAIKQLGLRAGGPDARHTRHKAV